MQRPRDGHAEPLSQRPGAALVEEVRGRAGLGADAVLQGLRQQDGAGADGAVWGQEGTLSYQNHSGQGRREPEQQ